LFTHFQSIVLFPSSHPPHNALVKGGRLHSLKSTPEGRCSSQKPARQTASKMQERFRAISHPAINNTEIQREKPANGQTSESMNHAVQTDLDSLSKQASSSSLCYLERPSITLMHLFSTKQWTFGSEEHQWGFERRQAEDVWGNHENSDCSFRSGKTVEIMHEGERTCRRWVPMQRVKNVTLLDTI